MLKIFIITAYLFSTFSTQAAIESLTCRTGGCNGEVCESLLAQPMGSTCEVREEYACYKTAKCERQKNGKCGWTPSKELEECLNKK
jgi:hypothetical protein